MSTANKKELTEEEKHLHHIEGGYKATLSNPASSEEAKKHAQEQLDKIAKGEKVEAANPTKNTNLTEEEKHLHHIEGGYKATLSNPASSEEAKKHAQEQLDKIAKGEKPEEGAHTKISNETEEEKHRNHVIGGFKATLSNAASSEEAKQNAREELKKLGVSEDDESEKKSLKRSSETEAAASPKKHKELTEEEKHQHHIEGGYKATLSNPNSSEEAKKHAQEQLDKIAKGEKVEAANPTYTSGSEHDHRVAGGYKATLSNPASSEEAKKHAREELKKMGISEDDKSSDKSSSTSSGSADLTEEEKHRHHVIGGYKATLTNAASSEEAKKHAREELKKLGASEDDQTESSDKSDSHAHGKQGFASMPTEKVKEIASKGGRTKHAGEEPTPLKNQ